MAVCGNCGTLLGDTSEVCQVCGRYLGPPRPPKPKAHPQYRRGEAEGAGGARTEQVEQNGEEGAKEAEGAEGAEGLEGAEGAEVVVVEASSVHSGQAADEAAREEELAPYLTWRERLAPPRLAQKLRHSPAAATLVALLVVNLILAGWSYTNLADTAPPPGDDLRDPNPLTPYNLTYLSAEAKPGLEGSYYVFINFVYGEIKLDSASYFLRDEWGLTDQFGLVGLQNMSGQWQGVEVTWDDEGTHDPTPSNGWADRPPEAGGPYPDPYQAQQRIEAVLGGYQQGQPYQLNEGVISVAFHDANLDGNLSRSDYFVIKGNSYLHRATEAYRFDIAYKPVKEPSGFEILESLHFGIPGNLPPDIQLESRTTGDGNYLLDVTSASLAQDLENFKFLLKNGSGEVRQSGMVGLQNLSGRWEGIDITWDDNGLHDPSPTNGVADRNWTSLGAYTDPVQAQVRITDVLAGEQTDKPYQLSEGTISVSFYDRDLNGKLTLGDRFIIKGNSPSHPADDAYTFELHYDGDRFGLEDERVAKIGLG